MIISNKNRSKQPNRISKNLKQKKNI